MSDLTELQAAGTTKVMGAGSSGIETYPLDVTSNGSAKAELHVGSQQIGNVGDRLKVDANFTVPPTVGEVELPTFTFYAENVAIGNNKSMISLVNTTGSTVIAKIREIQIISVQNTAVTGVVSDFKLFRCTSHSSGSALTSSTNDTADSLSASITGRTGATISGEETVALRHWTLSSDEWGVGAQDVESEQHAISLLVNSYAQALKTKPITLRANEGITIKHIVNSTAGSFDFRITFTVENT